MHRPGSQDDQADCLMDYVVLRSTVLGHLLLHAEGYSSTATRTQLADIDKCHYLSVTFIMTALMLRGKFGIYIMHWHDMTVSFNPVHQPSILLLLLKRKQQSP